MAQPARSISLALGLSSIAAVACASPTFTLAVDAALDASAPAHDAEATPDGSADVERAHDAGRRPDGARAPDAHVQDAATESGIPGADVHAPDAKGDASLPRDSGKEPDAPATIVTAPVDLKTAAAYVVLAETGVSTVPSAALVGNVGISPAAATLLTGFSLTLNATGAFATSPVVTGDLFAADYTAPTPSVLTLAVSDMESAFGDASGRTADFTAIGAGNLATMTLVPGVYSWTTPVLVTGDLTLDGSATDVWILQIAQTLTLEMGTTVTLTGGALPANVFWQVSGAVAFAGGAHLEGVLLGATSVELAATASVKGRVLAQTAVTIAGGVKLGS